MRLPVLLALLATVPLLSATAQVARPDTTHLDDLVVTATRTPWSADAVPAATTTLYGSDLRRRGVRFVADALREVPGFMLVQTGSYGAVASAFVRGGESDYLKVLVDGIPLNAPGGSLNLADLSLDDIERIEVVRGPTSVLYGADAVSGVVQLFTRQGGGRLRGTTSARAGDLGNREATLAVAGGGDRWRASAAGSSFRSDGIYPFNSAYRSATASLRLGYDAGDKGSVALTARASDVRAGFPTDGNGVPVDRNQFTTEETVLLGLEARRALSPGLKGVLHGFVRRVDAGAVNRPDTPADTSGFGFDSERDARTWRRGLETRLDWDVAPAARITTGVGVEREEETQRSRTVSNFGGGPAEELGRFAADRVTRHALVQLLAEPRRGVAIQAGVRLDDNSAFGTFTTARAGLTLQPTTEGRIWLAVGTAFKAPTFAELFADSPFEVGQPGLVAERTRNVEVGVERTLFNGSVVVGLTGFAQQFRDLIQYVSAAAGEPTYANLQGANARGIEASITARAGRNLTLKAHWTHLDTEVTDTGAVASVAFRQGEPLLRRPANSGGLTATLTAGTATLAATVTRVGERADADFRDFPAARVALPSYTLVDAAIDLPVYGTASAGLGLDLTLRAENLFDTAYEHVIGFPGRGRTILGGARLRF